MRRVPKLGIIRQVTALPRITALGVILLCCGTTCGKPLRSVAELDSFLNGNTQPRTEYDIKGTVVQQSAKGIVLEESDIRVAIPHTPRPLPEVGARIHLRGTAAVLPSGEPTIYGDQTFEIIGRGTVPATATVDLEHIDERRMDLRAIKTQGWLIGYLTDEIDPNYTILLIRQGRASYPVFIKTTRNLPAVGSRLCVTGIFNRKGSGGRKFARPFISSAIARIKVLEPASEDPFNAPRLETQLYLTPEEVSRLGRRSVVGRVLAVWDNNQLLIRSDADRIVNVRLLPDQPLPESGTVITVVGQPETDFYQLNLAFAIWRAEHGMAPPSEPLPEETSLSQLFLNAHKQQIVNYNYNGTLIPISSG